MRTTRKSKAVDGIETWDGTAAACKRLSVCSRTLYIWEKAGKLEGFQTDGGRWRWNVDAYMARQIARAQERRKEPEASTPQA